MLNVNIPVFMERTDRSDRRTGASINNNDCGVHPETQFHSMGTSFAHNVLRLGPHISFAHKENLSYDATF